VFGVGVNCVDLLSLWVYGEDVFRGFLFLCFVGGVVFLLLDGLFEGFVFCVGGVFVVLCGLKLGCLILCFG